MQKHITSCMTIGEVLIQSLKQGMEDDVPRLGAALAFYALLSLVPLSMFLVAMISAVYGQGSAREQIYDLILHYVGSQEAEAVKTILSSSVEHNGKSFMTIVISFLILVYGSSNVFSEWHNTLNLIWKVPTKPTNVIMSFLYQRLIAVLLVLGAGIVLIASVVLNTVLTALAHFTTGLMPVIAKTTWIWGVAVNLTILTLFFAASYKIIPDEKIAWKDVWIGSIITALFSNLGQFIIGFYLAHMNVVSGFGAAGSLIALLIWIYYSAQISFFGAEFTHIYAHRCGSYKTLAEQSMSSL